MSLFEYLKQDPEHKEAFDAYMSIRRQVEAEKWFETFPAEQQLSVERLKEDAEAVLVVDVGGSKGTEITKFGQRFPHLPGRLVNQDLPQTIQSIDPRPEGIELMEHDFFTEQPIKGEILESLDLSRITNEDAGARIYYLRAVLHDWSDEKCKLILSNIVAAMDREYSRVLIDDYVIPNTGASMRTASIDMLMLLYLGGLERTEHHWRQLLDAVGLEIVKVWPPKAGDECVIEAKVKSED